MSESPNPQLQTAPLLSVVIPAYRPQNFDSLLRSISGNLLPNVEWLVVDDGSGKTYMPTFGHLVTTASAPIKLLHLDTNQGQAAARNCGWRAANGDYINFLDADDELGPNHLSALLSALVNMSQDAIPFAPTLNCYPSGTEVENGTWKNLPHASDPQFLRMLTAPFVSHCGVLFPKSLLVQLDGYDETLRTDEDGDLLLRTLLAGRHFRAVAGVSYRYIHHGAEMRVSEDNSPEKLASRQRVCEKVLHHYHRAGGQVPAPIGAAVATRLDAIAMKNWFRFPQQSKNLIGQAEALCPGYPPSGHSVERQLRRLFGPSVALRTISALRALRHKLKGDGRK